MADSAFQVLANADIHLDNSAELLSSIDMTGVSSPYFIMRAVVLTVVGRAFAITRHDKTHSGGLVFNSGPSPICQVRLLFFGLG